MKNLILILKLCIRYKTLPLPFYFGKGSGSACYEISQVEEHNTKKLHSRRIGVSIFRCEEILSAVLHELGHIYQFEISDQFSTKDDAEQILKQERFASRYAKRLLIITHQNTHTRLNYLSWAYGTYLGHFYSKGDLDALKLSNYSYSFFEQMEAKCG